MSVLFKKASFAAVASAFMLSSAMAGELIINYDGSDPAPKKAFEMVIEKFEAANPDIKVKWNLFDHEGYKTSIRNFLTAEAPDVAAWYAGNRMVMDVPPPARALARRVPSWAVTMRMHTASPMPTPEPLVV